MTEFSLCLKSCYILENRAKFFSKSIKPLEYCYLSTYKDDHPHLWIQDPSNEFIILSISDKNNKGETILPSGDLIPLFKDRVDIGSVDSAYLEIVEKHFLVISSIVRSLKNGIKVYLTGYSSGACIAELIFIRIILSYSTHALDWIRSGFTFIGFGCSPFYDSQLKESIFGISGNIDCLYKYLLPTDHYHRIRAFASKDNFEQYPQIKNIYNTIKSGGNISIISEFEQTIEKIDYIKVNHKYDIFGSWRMKPVNLYTAEETKDLFSNEACRRSFTSRSSGDLTDYLNSFIISNHENILKKLDLNLSKTNGPYNPDNLPSWLNTTSSEITIHNPRFNYQQNSLHFNVQASNIELFKSVVVDQKSIPVNSVTESKSPLLDHQIHIIIPNANIHYLSSVKVKLVKHYQTTTKESFESELQLNLDTIKFENEDLSLTNILNISIFHLAITGIYGDSDVELALQDLDNLLAETSKNSESKYLALVMCSRIATWKELNDNLTGEELKFMAKNPQEYVDSFRNNKNNPSEHFDSNAEKDYWVCIEKGNLKEFSRSYLLPYYPFSEIASKYSQKYAIFHTDKTKTTTPSNKASPDSNAKNKPLVRSIFEAIQPSIFFMILTQLSSPLKQSSETNIPKFLISFLRWFPKIFSKYYLTEMDAEYHKRVNLLYFYSKGVYLMKEMYLDKPLSLMEMEDHILDHWMEIVEEHESQTNSSWYLNIDDPLFPKGFRDQDKGDTINFISIIQQVNNLRKLITKRCYISVAGVQNIGKSTLLNRGWGLDTKPGVTSNTIEPSCHFAYNGKGKIIKSPCFIDWPAITDKDGSHLAELIIPWSKICLCLVPCENANERPSLELIEKLINSNIRFMILLTKVDNLWTSILNDNSPNDIDSHAGDEDDIGDEDDKKIPMDLVKTQFWNRIDELKGQIRERYPIGDNIFSCCLNQRQYNVMIKQNPEFKFVQDGNWDNPANSNIDLNRKIFKITDIKKFLMPKVFNNLMSEYQYWDDLTVGTTIGPTETIKLNEVIMNNHQAENDCEGDN